nr:hypothetical protein OG781_16980 [Streptomyces sp. NBC_00830]
MEQKVAVMMKDIDEAHVVINYPGGPCPAKLGCNQVLDSLLGSKRLTVHFPDAVTGAWTSLKYGKRD